jgi:choline dehydrogenase-like flavoprotein
MNIQYVQGDCIFTRLNKLPKQYEYLTEDIDTDVIIVGGGVTGAILGYYFSKNNINTVILEKSRIAHASTSITTSLLNLIMNYIHFASLHTGTICGMLRILIKNK